MQPTSVSQYKEDVLLKPLCPIKELSTNNKRNSNVSTKCAPDSSSATVVERAEIKESRRSSRSHKPNPLYIDAESINSSLHCTKLMGYLKPSRTLKHADTFIIQINLKLKINSCNLINRFNMYIGFPITGFHYFRP